MSIETSNPVDHDLETVFRDVPCSWVSDAKPHPPARPRMRRMRFVFITSCLVLVLFGFGFVGWLMLMPSSATSSRMGRGRPPHHAARVYPTSTVTEDRSPIADPLPKLADDDLLHSSQEEVVHFTSRLRESQARRARVSFGTGKRQSTSRANSRSSSRPCGPGIEANNCIYADVLDADHRLRDAYVLAARQGLPSGELVEIRRGWDRARSISLDNPDETIRRYNGLVERLHADLDVNSR